MRSRRTVFGLTFVLLAVGIATSGIAQTPAAPAKKPGLMSRIKQKFQKKKPGEAASHAGQIIGNKNTKVYHMPGKGGSLPAEKNRVYFKTEAEAKAAGYHAAGSGGGKKAAAGKMTGAAKRGGMPK